jgi:hypothetical protein
VLDEKYDGGPFEVDVYCGTVPRPKVDPRAQPVQFSMPTLQPRWRQSSYGFQAAARPQADI